MAGSLLIVDDNDVDRERIRRFVGGAFATREAATAAEALAVSDAAEIDCVLLDHRLPDRNGVDLIGDLAARQLPVIMLTGQGDESVAVDAMKRGAHDYLVKGAVDAASLRRAVHNAIDKQRMQRRIDAQQRELESRLDELARRGVELEAANRGLEEREEKLRVIMRQLPAIVWTCDEELRYTSASGLARLGLLSEDDVLGRPAGFFVTDEEDREAFLHAHRSALTGRPARFELTWNARSLQGTVEPLRDGDGRTSGVIGAALDVTENRQLEHQLERSQKMEALGTLAGGVAHDFNNILTAILSFAGFVREELEPRSTAAEDIQQVLNAAERGATLVRQLLAFSRQRPVQHRVVDVNAVVSALLPMMRRLVGEDIQMELALQDDLWRTRIDPGGLEQMVINMTVNARDAMPRGGRLSIATENLVLEESLPTRREAGLAPGSYIVLAICDEGCGIPPEVQEQIFEPFFTTKDVGRGTGLGLATCWGIARQAGGSISVYSEVGRGTAFKIYLPRHAGPLDEHEGRSSSPGLAAGGTETVLVVEDDPQVRALAVRTLRGQGYEVLEAEGLLAAERLVAGRGADVALVLSDVVMPAASGPELFARMRERLPRARVLYMSGYTGATMRQRGLLEKGVPIIEKPFTPEALSRKVRQVLDRE